jgi:hypothetical protein
MSAIVSSTIILYIRGIIKRNCREENKTSPNIPVKDYLETLV